MKRTALIVASLVLSSFAGGSDSSSPAAYRIEVNCGKVTLLLRRQSQWTPGRIDYRGNPMTTEKSAYGTVFSFPDVGFIGTAHLENEPEKLERVAFFLDGDPVESPAETLTGETFRFERDSQVRGFRMNSTIEIRDDRLHEEVRLRTSVAVPQNQIYHFMHAWVPTVSHFLAGIDERETIAGELTDEEATLRRFYIQERVDWVAVYDAASNQFAVSRLLEAPEGAGNRSQIWNVPPTYRKYYLKCFQNDTVPAGFDGTWRMVTGFGSSPLSEWEDRAEKLAGKLRKP